MAKAKAPADTAPETVVNDEDIELFTTAEAAEKLRICKRNLAGRVAAMEVPHTRIGRRVFFRRDHILAILRMGDVDPATRGRRRAA